jgi:hypothetical protein
MKTITNGIGLILILLLTQSCYHYRVSSANFDPSTNYSKKTVHSFLWGAIQKRTNGIDVVTDNCDSLQINKVDEVRVTTNFGYSLINVVTLGIWCPMQIQWKCAKPCGRIGTIPESPSPSPSKK